MASRVGSVFVSAQVSVAGCGTEATDTAKVCTQSDLIAQCPAGSTPQLEASATSQCSGKVDGSVIEESGSATGSCAGTGDCTVLCQFSTPCNCGVALLTKDEIQCVTPCDRLAVCGNNACESGESIQNCPADCGAGVCIARETRCNGDIKQVCNQVGGWDDLACPTGTFCRGDGVCVDPNCVPACDGKTCGADDGCGVQCPDADGVCGTGYVCESGECVDEQTSTGCTPNDTRACTCSGGDDGTQTCGAAGSWGECLCTSFGVGAIRVSKVDISFPWDTDTNLNGKPSPGESACLRYYALNTASATASVGSEATPENVNNLIIGIGQGCRGANERPTLAPGEESSDPIAAYWVNVDAAAPPGVHNINIRFYAAGNSTVTLGTAVLELDVE